MRYDFSDLNETKLLPVNSVHEFEIVDCTEQISKRGIPMIKLELSIHSKGQLFVIFSYVSSELSWMVKNFLDSIGWSTKSGSGEFLPEDLIGKTGQAEIGINDKNPQYKPTNSIKRFLPFIPVEQRITHIQTVEPIQEASPEKFSALRNKIRSLNKKVEPEIVDDDVPFDFKK